MHAVDTIEEGASEVHTPNMPYSNGRAESQIATIHYVSGFSLGPNITIMLFVHPRHMFGLGGCITGVCSWQFENDIPIESRRQYIDLVNVNGIVVYLRQHIPRTLQMT